VSVPGAVTEHLISLFRPLLCNNFQHLQPCHSPVISPHELSSNLPPLQPHPYETMHMYGSSAPHASRTPANLNTPGSANTLSTFPQMGVQARNYQVQPTGVYQQQHLISSSMLPQSSTAISRPQPIAPAPAPHRMSQALCPMPPHGLQHMQSGMHGQPNKISLPPLWENLEPPIHVVGSQGRRGILPNAPGRPPVTAIGTGSTKNTLVLGKDAEGKFPCPHCTKTYLHAKHRKRHLLRRELC
jgi:hypothetical protein